jgi:hypothetical protein
MNKLKKYKPFTENDLLSGGLADRKTLMDIALHHGVPIQIIKSEFDKGLKVEMEHTNDPKIAAEIAMDHLWESSTYYSDLISIEKH